VDLENGRSMFITDANCNELHQLYLCVRLQTVCTLKVVFKCNHLATLYNFPFQIYSNDYSSGSQTVHRGAPETRGLFTGAPRNIVKAL
jgi:hypothetical protein